MASLLHTVLRSLLPGAHGEFAFESRQSVELEPPASINLYIHVPFCNSICSFCPYVKEIYDPLVSAHYQAAVLEELSRYRERWGEVAVDSVYFGGGTPSLTPHIIETTTEWISGHFRLDGCEVGVEVHPVTARDAVLRSLRCAGVTCVSLGVQTFNDRLLGILGRGYTGVVAHQACERVVQAGFETVDLDLMFALPSQTLKEAESDIQTAFGLGVDQVSTYPLIPFSHTPLKSCLNAQGLRLPSLRREKAMLQMVVDAARSAGYERSSIWSFNWPGSGRYTTVTKDSFVGIGAGAASRMGDYFWLNTFSVTEYIRAIRRGPARSLATRMSDADKAAYWLFWQCYNLSIDAAGCRSACGVDLPRPAVAALRLLSLIGLAHRDGNIFRLTNRGAYLFHLVEKEYTQTYLRSMWEACLAEPWPEVVRL